MAQYESSPRTRFRRDVFLRCEDCGHVFINMTSSGTFCRRCRGGELALWLPRVQVRGQPRRARL